MRAMALIEYGKDLVEIELADPTPGEDEVVLEVTACGVCQTDLKIAAGIHPSCRRAKLPFVPGHEIAGRVLETGKNVKNWKPGDTAVVHYYLTCGTCKFCRDGIPTLCSGMNTGNAFSLGFTRNGGLGEKICLPARNLIRISPDVPAAEAAIIPDAVATAVRAVTVRAEVRPGERVLIYGAGGVGLHALQAARLSGAHTTVVDIDAGRLQTAKDLGADEIVFGSQEACAGITVDKILETSGVLADNMWLMNSLAVGGTLVVVGNKVGAYLKAGVMELTSKEQTIKGSRGSTVNNLATTVELVERGLIKPLVGTTYTFPQVNEALADLKAGKINGRGVLCKDL